MTDTDLAYLEPTVTPSGDPSAPVLGHTDAADTGRTASDGRPIARQRTESIAAGVWGYHAGTSGTVTCGVHERVLSIACQANVVSGQAQINGGDVIPVPIAGFAAGIEGDLRGATIVFTNTVSYFVEVVTLT